MQGGISKLKWHVSCGVEDEPILKFEFTEDPITQAFKFNLVMALYKIESRQYPAFCLMHFPQKTQKTWFSNSCSTTRNRPPALAFDLLEKPRGHDSMITHESPFRTPNEELHLYKEVKAKVIGLDVFMSE